LGIENIVVGAMLFVKCNAACFVAKDFGNGNHIVLGYFICETIMPLVLLLSTLGIVIVIVWALQFVKQ
jgi:hypothetical protein